MIVERVGLVGNGGCVVGDVPLTQLIERTNRLKYVEVTKLVDVGLHRVAPG